MKINTSVCIMSTFLHLCHLHKKSYCWPTRKKMLFLLSKYHGIKICYSALDHQLSRLAKNGWIKSFRRSGVNSDGTRYLLPSNRQLTRTALRRLTRLGVNIENWLHRWMKDGSLPFKPRKPRAKKAVESKGYQFERPASGGLEPIGDILKTVFDGP